MLNWLPKTGRAASRMGIATIPVPVVASVAAATMPLPIDQQARLVRERIEANELGGVLKSTLAAAEGITAAAEQHAASTAASLEAASRAAQEALRVQREKNVAQWAAEKQQILDGEARRRDKAIKAHVERMQKEYAQLDELKAATARRALEEANARADRAEQQLAPLEAQLSGERMRSGRLQAQIETLKAAQAARAETASIRQLERANREKLRELEACTFTLRGRMRTYIGP